jgi:hypothetical protein
MKIILIPLVGLMVPVALLFLAYDIAREWAENELEKLIQKEKK